MVHPFNTDSTNVTVTGSWRSVDIASHTELNAVDLDALRDDIADLNMTFNVFILWNCQVLCVGLIFLGLCRKRCTIF